jgi:hypothetical protein
MLAVTVSGSFHRHIGAITAAVHELTGCGVRVLSPADPTIVSAQGDFLFVASDRVRSVRLVQDRHLECIRAADFLWLVCPDGYVGQSASMEVGYAAALGVPIFGLAAPADITMRHYVTRVQNIRQAVASISDLAPREGLGAILLDPRESVEQAHQSLEQIENALTSETISADPSRAVYREIRNLQRRLQLPTYTQ